MLRMNVVASRQKCPVSRPELARPPDPALAAALALADPAAEGAGVAPQAHSARQTPATAPAAGSG
jgi:hypothetical protein